MSWNGNWLAKYDGAWDGGTTGGGGATMYPVTLSAYAAAGALATRMVAAQRAAQTALAALLGRDVFATLATASAATAAFDAIKVRLVALFASIGAEATVPRAIQALRHAETALGGALTRGVGATYLTGVSAQPSAVKAVAATFAGVVGTVASWVWSIFTGDFWSLDRTYRVPMSRRTLIVGNPPRNTED